jgi:hypothetical protein
MIGRDLRWERPVFSAVEAWHLANTQRVKQQVTLTKVDLIGY